MGLFDSIFRSTKSYGSLETTEGTYEGDLVNDKPHGKGVFSFDDGGRYEGDFVKGAFSGKGVMTYTADNRYEGEFVNGKRHGKGVYIFPSGKRYEGDFADNDIHGSGTIYAEDGSVAQKGRWHHYTFVGMTGLTATEGDFVVLELIADALLTDHVLRSCIETIDAANDLDKQMIIGFVHYLFARPIGMSECSKTDADHILGALLDMLMTTAPELDYAETKETIPTIYRLLSAGDPATVHIRTSTAFFLQAMENSGHKINDDDSKLKMLSQVVEPLQVEVQFFLNFVLNEYVLDWTKQSGELTEAKRRQAADIAALRKMVREESERMQAT